MASRRHSIPGTHIVTLEWRSRIIEFKSKVGGCPDFVTCSSRLVEKHALPSGVCSQWANASWATPTLYLISNSVWPSTTPFSTLFVQVRFGQIFAAGILNPCVLHQSVSCAPGSVTERRRVWRPGAENNLLRCSLLPHGSSWVHKYFKT